MCYLKNADDLSSSDLSAIFLDRTFQEKTPSPVLLGLEKHSIFGEFCDLGLSSMWMNGAVTSEREVALGPFIPSSFGATLYAGQRSRMNSSVSGLVAITSFHVGNLIVAPPQFTPFLFMSLLILTSEQASDNDSEWQLLNCPRSSPELIDTTSRDLARDIFSCTLRKVRTLGSSTSSLRIITLKVIELLIESKVRNNRCLGSDRLECTSNSVIHDLHKWKVGKAMLSEIVSVVSMLFDTLGFATFFLSIGRQLEPHQFNLIFPLPEGSPAATAEDLFSLSCERGSLMTALSALPLFSCHKESQKSVTRLVYHCLTKIDENFQSSLSNSAMTSVEDEAFLHQLFWFGVKLEDAIEIGTLHDEADGLDCASSQFSVESSSVESTIGDDSDDYFDSASSDSANCTSDTCSLDESHEVSFLSGCRTPKQKPRSGILQRVFKRILVSSESPIDSVLQEEDAIHEEASSFILSGLGEASTMSRGNENLPSHCSPPTSVAGAVCLFIEYEIIFAGAENEYGTLRYGWKAVSLIAHFLQGERETNAITSAGTANAKAITRMLKIKDFLSCTPYDGSHLKDDDSCAFLTSLLVEITSRCRQQIHSEAASSIFNLVLLLLLRNDACYDVQLCRTTLIMVGIVSGHLSGRICELLSDTSCDVNKIYSLFAARIRYS